jgi:acyl-CoA synthetase (AMP-forming)/AMP-acid ligase II
MAITSLGAVVVPLNAWWETDELVFGLEDCGANVVIADQERMSKLSTQIERLGLTAIAVRSVGKLVSGALHYQDVMADVSIDNSPKVAVSLEDNALILYTSGTSGKPKGAISTHRAVMSAPMGFAVHAAVTAATRAELAMDAPAPEEYLPSALLSMPLFHVTGCHVVFLLSLIAGRKLTLMYKWDPEEALKLMEREKVTYFLGVPTMAWDIVQHPDLDKYDLSALSVMGTGGAPRPVKQAQIIAQKFPTGHAGQGYGLTESNGVGCSNMGEEFERYVSSVGRPVVGVVEIAIWDDKNTRLMAGETGEVMIKSVANMTGYWNNPAATSEIFTDGWLHTGDIGYLDENDYLFIVDRKKEIVIRGGENISVTEVEQIVHRHPAVREVAVFGVPDQRLGEVMCAVVATEQAQKVSEQDLRNFLNQNLSAFKVPEYFFVQSEPLLRGTTGKLLKRGMRDLAMEKINIKQVTNEHDFVVHN